MCIAGNISEISTEIFVKNLPYPIKNENIEKKYGKRWCIIKIEYVTLYPNNKKVYSIWLFHVCISSTLSISISNLVIKVRESDLREVMEEYGTVDSVRIITDRETRRSKGFAFIEMPDSAEASNAINALNGAEYGGRPMVVKEALPKN